MQQLRPTEPEPAPECHGYRRPGRAWVKGLATHDVPHRNDPAPSKPIEIIIVPAAGTTDTAFASAGKSWRHFRRKSTATEGSTDLEMHSRVTRPYFNGLRGRPFQPPPPAQGPKAQRPAKTTEPRSAAAQERPLNSRGPSKRPGNGPKPCRKELSKDLFLDRRPVFRRYVQRRGSSLEERAQGSRLMLRLHGTLHDGEPLPRAVPAAKIGPFRGRKGPKRPEKQQKYAKIKRNQPKTMKESEALGRSKRPLRAHRRVHDGFHLRLAQHTAAPVLELGRFRRIRHPNHPKSSEIKQNQAISRIFPLKISNFLPEMLRFEASKSPRQAAPQAFPRAVTSCRPSSRAPSRPACAAAGPRRWPAGSTSRHRTSAIGFSVDLSDSNIEHLQAIELMASI